MTLALQAMPLTCLVLLLLHNALGLGAQPYPYFKLQQPRGPVVVIKGEVLTLKCTTVGIGPIGPTKWLKVQGSSNQTIYDKKGSVPRVTKVDTESNEDFSIRIRDVRLEDTGTYYCVKFVKVTFGEEFVTSGGGTEVLVHARPSELVMSEPSDRAVPGQSVPFTCSTRGFFPREIQVKWLKNSTPVRAVPPPITAELPDSLYSMSSTVQVKLSKDDVRSELTCEVQHSTLPAPLNKTYVLGRVLRVPPSVSVVAAPPGAVQVNETVNFTCRVQGFYPGAVSITWLENGTEMNAGSSAQPTETSQGLFEQISTLMVQAGEEKSGSRFTCRVVHENQEPISSTYTLRVFVPTSGETESFIGDSRSLIYVAVGVVCTVLALLVIAILYLIRTKQSKDKSSPSARLHEPEKSSMTTTTQESDPNNLTYADLNFAKEKKKSIRRIIELSQQSEYACIQGSNSSSSSSQQAANNDNLTYADLDMVHLSKAPRRPPPCPEESSSEYASVQIQRQ